MYLLVYGPMRSACVLGMVFRHGPDAVSALAERLRRELYDSEQRNASLECTLRCKDQECESLTRLVRELTAARAKAASAKHHLQASDWTMDAEKASGHILAASMCTLNAINRKVSAF